MLSDFRYALRQLANAPGLTAVIVLSLGLGIGANTTVFCWIESLLLRPLPGVAQQDDLVILTTSQGERMWDTLSLPDIRDIAAMHDVFAGVTGSQQTPACLTADDRSEWLYGQIVTANFFDVFGVKPILGRTFLPEEDLKPSGHPVLVISERLWRKRFGGDPNIIGRVVDLNRHAFTIVGVAPGNFYGDVTGLSCEFWAPVMMHHEVAFSGIDPNQVLQRYAHWHHTYARLQPGVSVKTASAALSTLSLQLETAHPDTNRDIRLHAWSLWNSTYGAQKIFRSVLGLLLAVSLGVLLVVTANVANLLLARAVSRQKEIAIRLAVGAGRARLVRQLLTESLVLAIAGGAAGVLLAHWMIDLFQFFIPKTHLPILLSMNIDQRTLLVSAGLTLVAGLIFGLVPAFQASHPQLQETLKAGGRGAGGTVAHHRARSLLVISEIALALVLLVGAGLCVKGLRQSQHVETGLDSNGVLLAGLRVGMNGYSTETAPAFYRALRQRVRELPGVEAVALANWFPLGFEDTGSANVKVPADQNRKEATQSYRLSIVSPGYFEALHIPLVAGRDFTDRDDPKSPRVAIVNETMAQRFWPGQDAVGRTFKSNGRDLQVVGVAKAGKYRALSDPPECFFYLPCAQAPWALDLGVCVRLREGDPAAFASTLAKEIHAIDPGVHIWQALSLNSYIEAALVSQRMASSLLTLLSAVALVLAAMGVYAVMAYAVSQRTREFGVRMALGAQPSDVMWQVSRQTLMLAAVGIVVGLLLAAGLTRFLTSFLYGVSPFDPVTFISVPLLLAGIAFLAGFLPARRATQVSPIDALRAE